MSADLAYCCLTVGSGCRFAIATLLSVYLWLSRQFDAGEWAAEVVLALKSRGGSKQCAGTGTARSCASEEEYCRPTHALDVTSEPATPCDEECSIAGDRGHYADGKTSYLGLPTARALR